MFVLIVHYSLLITERIIHDWNLKGNFCLKKITYCLLELSKQWTYLWQESQIGKVANSVLKTEV